MEVALAKSAVTDHIEGATHAVVDGFTLQAIAGTDAGAQLRSRGESAVVGTHDSAALVLRDPTVSRFHFRIELDQGRLVIEDQGSRNGTRVDGVSVQRAFLHDGAVISAGRTQLRFELAGSAVRLPLSTRARFGSAIGVSQAMRAVFHVLERAAASDATVLLEGETGTGKEVIAESIHQESARADGPFVVVDCSAIPRDLLESELFGHERGAFTGALAAREGAFEAASGGTIFLDEIGELPLDLQPKLLRALERREVKRVGSNRHAKVDVRIVAATNRNLRAEVNAGKFRSDLYYRLAVVQVALPPLRQRAEDIALLVQHVVTSLGARERVGAAALLRPEIVAAMQSHPWPGNVRELRNYVERCIALNEPERLRSDEEHAALANGVAPAIDVTRPLREGREAWVSAFERAYLEGALAAHGGNVTAAARASKIDRIHFYRLLWQHGLR